MYEEVATLLVKDPLDVSEAHCAAKRFPDMTASRLPASKLRRLLTDKSMIYSNEYQLKFVVAMTSSYRERMHATAFVRVSRFRMPACPPFTAIAHIFDLVSPDAVLTCRDRRETG